MRLPTQSKLVGTSQITIPESRSKIMQPSFKKQGTRGELMCADTDLASESFPYNGDACKLTDLASKTFPVSEVLIHPRLTIINQYDLYLIRVCYLNT